MLFSPKRTCFRFAARTLRVQGSQGNPSGAARQLPLHRGAKVTPQARSGLRRGARATPQSAVADSSPLRTETTLRDVPVLRMAFFPKRAYDALFSKTLMLQVRCANPTGTGEPGKPLSPLWRTASPFAPKRPFGTFRCCGRLISTKSTQYSLLQNARPSGSLRSPYGYRGAKAALRAALLREKRPRRRLLRGRWRRGIGIFTASGGCRPVRCGRR